MWRGWVNTYISVFFKCHKYGHNTERERGCLTCERYGQMYPDHMEKGRLSETKWPKCLENLSLFSRSCDIYKREREIIEIKYKRNITSFETRKIMEFYMKENTRITIIWRVKPISNNSRPDNYRTLVKKLIQIETKWLAKVSGATKKNLHSARIHQIKAQLTKNPIKQWK